MTLSHPVARGTLVMAAALLAGCTTAGGPATAGKPARADTLIATGQTTDCIQIRSIRNSDVRDDRTIDFHMLGGDIYRNRLPNSCPSLGFERRFAYKTSLSQLCSVDIITVLYSGAGPTQGASCGLGSFEKMKKAPK